MEIKRTNPKIFEVIAQRLKELDGIEAKAGWLESSHYGNGMSVAEVAQIQEFGAHINHPGGTPYRINADGRAEFISKANGAGLPVTQPHAIVIPPRPFMRPTVIREKQNWLNMMVSGAKAVAAGNANPADVLSAIAQNAAGEIKRSITLVTAPPLKPATIRARLRRKSDKTTLGLLSKPLVDTGTMLEGVISSTEKT